MAVLAVQDALVIGINEALVDAGAGGDSFPNNGLCLLHVVNGGGGAITVTIDDLNTPTPAGASSFNADVTINVPAGENRFIGPLPAFRFNDENGRVNVTYSGVTSVTVGVIRIRP